MRDLFPVLFFCLVSFTSSFAQKDTTFPVKYFSTVPGTSIRALEVLNDSTAWFAADKGRWGYTDNAGKFWHTEFMKMDSVYPDFRSIAVLNDSTVLLLNVASPAYLFKTTNKGKTWKIVYANDDKNIFFDSMKFPDAKNGMAVADPIGGCFQMIITKDGGETWNKVSCDNIPKAKDGEAMFASSNTCLDSYKNNIWFVTGGKRACIFHATDPAMHFEVFDTPIVQGGKMTGIFSLDFFNDKVGLIAGGDYEKTDLSIAGLAITNDGGKTWSEIKSSKAFFGSCVRFLSADVFFITGHDGTYFGNYKAKQFKEVKDSSGSSLKFNTLRFSPSGKTMWMAGSDGVIARLEL
jgi:photosystem II stability/assembly factor-like uncharacterized protein